MRLPWPGRTELRVLVVGLAALAIGVLVVASRSADRVAALNGTLLQSTVAALEPGSSACQPDAIPPEAGRVRVPATVAAGAVRARVVVDGEAGGWAPARDGALVVVLPAGAEGAAEVCIESEGPGRADLLGAATGEADRLRIGAGRGTGRMRIDYLYGAAEQSLWSNVLPALPERIAAANGSAWAPWLVAVGLLSVLAAIVALVAGPSRRREVLAVVVLALGSAGTWAGFTPLFQASDELAHAAYVQVFAELGHPPRNRSNTGEVSEEMGCWATVVRLEQIRFFDPERPPWRRSPADPCAGTDRRKDAAQYQSAQPPAYYALASVGYRAGDLLDRPLPDRLLLTRLISALLAAVTILCAFLLVREALPASPWPARAAALAAGLQPVVMFNHGAINSDALVVSTTAALAALLARIWRRGPTLRRAVLLGALLGIGIVAKITFLLVVPCAIAVQLLIWLRHRELSLGRRAALLAAAWATALLPGIAYVLLGDAIFEPSVQNEASVAPPAAGKLRVATHVWQAFLPQLPFMEDAFAGRRPPGWYALLQGSTGRLGWWDDYGIAAPASTLVVLGAVALVGFAALAAVRRRAWRLPLAVAAGFAGAYTLMLVWALYIPGDFQVQGRYLTILTPVWALAAGTAVAALRPQRQPAAAAVLAVGMLGWTGLALAATLDRWYL